MNASILKKMLPFCGLLACAVPGTALAAGNGFYVGLNAGVTITNDSDWSSGNSSGDIGYENSANFGGALGYQGHPNVRGEVEVSYRQADLEDISENGVGTFSLGGDLSTLTVLANVYYDFTTGSEFSPYISGGIGMASHDAEVNNVAGVTLTGLNDDDTVFAYQFGAGFSYEINSPTALVIGYRFLGSDDPTFMGQEIDYDAHEIRGGVRFYF